MLKERKILLAGILVVAAVALGGVLLFGRGRRRKTLNSVEREYYMDDSNALRDFKSNGVGTKYVEHEVLCMTDSEEEAKKVADAVNGKLKSWQNGVAVISIEETVQEFLKKHSGDSNLPAMYPNYVYQAN